MLDNLQAKTNAEMQVAFDRMDQVGDLLRAARILLAGVNACENYQAQAVLDVAVEEFTEVFEELETLRPSQPTA